MMPTSLEWLAIAINLAAAGVNLWQIRRWHKRNANLRELEARYTQLIVEQMAAKYYNRGFAVRDPARPLQH